jgi:hypothetical protein
MSLTKKLWKSTAGHSSDVASSLWWAIGISLPVVPAAALGITAAVDIAAGVGSAIAGAAKAGGKAMAGSIARRSNNKHELAMEAERTRRRSLEATLVREKPVVLPPTKAQRIVELRLEAEDVISALRGVVSDPVDLDILIGQVQGAMAAQIVKILNE